MKDVQTYLGEIKKQIKEISVEDLKKKVDKKEDVLLIDVREKEETDGGIIPGAKTIPRGFLELKIENLESRRDRQIVINCAGGNRSALAARSLNEMGYKNVSSLKGGYAAWQHAGFLIEQKKTLSTEKLARYARHISMPEVGEEGQMKLLAAKVLLIGAGGLGSPAGLYLAAAGVGTLGIIDNDVVDKSNLQRQILHDESWEGRPKVESAVHRLRGINSDITAVPHQMRLDRTNVRDIFSQYDIIVNGCDNFSTRYLVNDACFFLKKPLVDGSIFRFEGQVTVFDPASGGPCYRCLYPLPPPPDMAPSCQEAGVFGVLPGIIGSLQAVEVIKLIINQGEPLVGKLLLYDALKQKFRELKIRRDQACPLCGDKPTVTDLIDYEWFCSTANAHR
ncbi:MAG: molybdopterin-synthase adenylyltransferase MoeB [Deltaproteobacteria bacterium]|nr:molybdopterin-synthase adenylyltransferase MoeB [Deltaproteobacteria bacterium]